MLSNDSLNFLHMQSMEQLAVVFIFLFLCVHCFVMVRQNVQSGLTEGERNAIVIYDITLLVDESLQKGKEEWARTSIQKLLREGDAAVFYDAGTKIQEFSQISNAIKMIDKVTSGNLQTKIFISASVRSPFINIPNLYTSTASSFQMSGLSALIFSIDCKEIMDLQNLSRLINRLSYSTGISIGLRYHNSFSCLPSPSIMKNTGFLFIEVDFTSQVGFPDSYPIFRNHLQSIAEKHTQIKDFTSVSFHLRLISSSEKIPPDIHLQYDLLLLQYGKRWCEESRSSVIITFSSLTSFTKLIPTNRRRRSASRSSVIIPWLYNYLPGGTTPKSLMETLRKVSSLHEGVHVELGMWRQMARILNKLESGEKLAEPLKATVWVANSQNYTEKTVALKEKLKRRNVILDTLDFGWSLSSQKPNWFENIAAGIKTICGFYAGSSNSSISPAMAVHKIKHSCGFLFDLASGFYWIWYIDYLAAAKENFSKEFYDIHIQQKLNDALLARKELLLAKPMAEVKLILYFPHHPVKDPTFSFYCNEGLLKFNAYFEAIGNWARDHEFPVQIPYIFPDFMEFESNKTSWWSRVKVGEEISQDITKNMPVYVLRNFPGKFLNQNVFLDSCVKWSGNVPQEGIPVDKDMSGMSISMNFREKVLSVSELETMLVFALRTFTTVELLLTQNAICQLIDLQTLNSLLTTGFLEALVDFDILGGRLYLEISAESTNFPQTLEQVEKLAEKISQGPKSSVKLSGIHLINWDNSKIPEAVIQQVATLGNKFNFKVGLVVDSCATLLNKLAKSKTSTSVPTTDYILCLTKHFPAHNENKEDLAIKLDTHLYMSKLFQNFLPGRSIHFRVNSFLCCEGDSEEKKTEKLFRFLNDVNQFAVGNELRHFFVQAFTTTSGSSSVSSSSWFSVKTFTDLSSASAVIDREEVFLNRSISQHSQKSEILRKKLEVRKKVLVGMILSTHPPQASNCKAAAITNRENANTTQSSLNLFPNENDGVNSENSKMKCSREEVCPCCAFIPIGFGYSLQNHVILTQTKIFQLGQLPFSETILDENKEGLNVRRVDEWRSCFKVFRTQDTFFKGSMKALGLSPTSFPVEGFGKTVFRKHPCFNLISSNEAPSPLAMSSFSSTVDFVTFSVEVNDDAKLEHEFLKDLSRLDPHNISNSQSEHLWSFFFKLYGTHVVTKVDLGGSILIKIKLINAENESEEIDDLEKLGILHKAVGDISSNLQLAGSNNAIFTKGIHTVDPRVTFTLSHTGGNTIHYFANFSEMNTLKNVTKWRESLKEHPVILPTSLKLLPLDEAVSRYGRGVSIQIPTWIKNAVGKVYKQRVNDVQISKTSKK